LIFCNPKAIQELLRPGVKADGLTGQDYDNLAALLKIQPHIDPATPFYNIYR
jgi:hypothetical protein